MSVRTLLHLDSSADRTSESVTRRLTGRYAERWRKTHGDAGYRYRDLAAETVPPLDTAYCQLARRVEEYAPPLPLDKVAALAAGEAEERQWAITLPIVEEARAADTILIGVPMYNLTVPAALKAWIDRFTFPVERTCPGTGESVFARTRVILVAARGGAYGPGAPGEGNDFQLPYLRALFRRYGVPEGNIRHVAAELTLAPVAPHLSRSRPAAARSLASALAAIEALPV